MDNGIRSLELNIRRVRRILEVFTPKEMYIYEKIEQREEGALTNIFFYGHNQNLSYPSFVGILKGVPRDEFIKDLMERDKSLRPYGNMPLDGITSSAKFEDYRAMTREEFIEKLNVLWETEHYDTKRKYEDKIVNSLHGDMITC